jgi:EAL domain-containing protein (putative c-di-GMP-specific phosphodiesterase class I)
VPWDFIKLDRSLVEKVPHSERANTVLKSTLSMARDLGARTIAEGIENNKQRTFLVRSGCEFAQGFIWSKPMDLSSLVAALGRCQGAA